jgi:acetate kinase
MQAKGMSALEIEKLLYKQSGRLGVSGLSNDMQVLQDSSDPHAQEAIDIFCYRAASALAALVPSIEGLDALVFTAGIGENSPYIRKLICKRLEWLGVALDDSANNENTARISTVQSKVAVFSLRTNEEVVVARACQDLLPRVEDLCDQTKPTRKDSGST